MQTRNFLPEAPSNMPHAADPPPPAHYYHRAPEPLVHNVYIAERTPLQRMLICFRFIKSEAWTNIYTLL